MTDNDDIMETESDGEILFDQEEAAPEAKPGPRDWESEARKARKEAHSLRSRLRKTEIELNYGADIASLIPDELPVRDWERFAEMIQARIPEPAVAVARPDGEDAAPTLEPTPEEQRIAVAFAAGSSAYHGEADIAAMTAKEIMELGKENPALAARQIRQQYRNQ